MSGADTQWPCGESEAEIETETQPGCERGPCLARGFHWDRESLMSPYVCTDCGAPYMVTHVP